jgi:transposase-like protein
VACEALRAQFTIRYHKLAPKAVERLADDWERLVTFYQFPREHWPHLRTSNVVESVRHEASPWNGVIPVPSQVATEPLGLSPVDRSAG